MKFRHIFILVVIAFLLIQCAKKQPVPVTPPPPTPVPVQPSPISGKFSFGLEYGVPYLASTYAETGLQTMKPSPILVHWDRIQPSQNSAYDWSIVDSTIKEYQSAGFPGIQLLITAQSDWASRGKKDTRPKPEFEDDYQNFVRAAVERYDSDGINDMPGLIYPISQWGVEREFTAFFPGTGSDYVEVLKLAYPKIKEANPNAKVMLNALLMWDIFQGNPDDGEIQRRLANPPGGKRKDITDVPVLLDAYNYFDIIDIHSLSDYSELPATARWLRNEMSRRGTSREIYAGDAFPMSPLLAYGLESCKPGIFAAKEFYPVTSETRCEASRIIDAIRKKSDPSHDESLRWLEKQVAIGLTRKYATAAAEGYLGINIGNLEDWPIPFGAGTSSNFGLIDTSYSGGDQLTAKRTPKERRPGFYAAKMASRLQGFNDARRLSTPENVYAYEFNISGSEIIVAWYDDGKFYGLDANLPSAAVSLPWKRKTAAVTEIPTERGQTHGASQTVGSENGKITFTLGYVPVFVG
ncbi:hypothetical protein HY638_02120 [Candidatus Woesearchaeota archaeon]|nr:hypothetical protein [Candidatus Woesearchaeota archaeon]